MESTKKSSRKSASSGADQLSLAYVQYLLTHGQPPASVYKFCLDNGWSEETFFQHFASLEAIEKFVWKGFIERTVARLRADEAFTAFSTREKVLAFYFTLLEELKTQRSLVLMQLGHLRKLELTPAFMKDFKASFEQFFETILLDGKSKGEVAARPFLDKQYPQIFWFHLGFILMFWKEDDSPGFEKTDAAVEKSVNLAFDLIGKGALDSAIDFAKFLYQSKK
jgi:AcrR family transcriptional regulator